MKKIITTLAVAVVATGVFAQGTISTINGSGLLVSTNGSAAVPAQGTGITQGNQFYYALLEDASATVTGGNVTGLTANPLNSATWTFSGVMMTNINNGLLNGGTAVADSMWGFNTTNAFFVVGWSTSLGTTWLALSNNLAASVANGGNWTTAGYYGISAVGFGQPGGGTPSNPTFHIFSGATSQGTGVSGFVLNAVPVPEPATLALAGLGGLSLLMFRRQRK
jgi:hypothetical protein